MLPNKIIITVLSLILISFGAKSFAQTPCMNGQNVTLLNRMSIPNSNGVFIVLEPGTRMQVSNLFGQNGDGRIVLDLDQVKGIGVAPIYGTQGQIVSCEVQNQRIASFHVCVGKLGNCSSSWSPSSLNFLECSVNP